MERSGRWTVKEHTKFLDAIKVYGKNWVKVSRYIGSRNSTQVRSHAQKHFLREANAQKMKVDVGQQLDSRKSGVTMKDSSSQYGEGMLLNV